MSVSRNECQHRAESMVYSDLQQRLAYLRKTARGPELLAIATVYDLLEAQRQKAVQREWTAKGMTRAPTQAEEGAREAEVR